MNEVVTIPAAPMERTLAVSAVEAAARPILEEPRLSARARLLALAAAALGSWGIVILAVYALYAVVA